MLAFKVIVTADTHSKLSVIQDVKMTVSQEIMYSFILESFKIMFMANGKCQVQVDGSCNNYEINR